MADRRREILTFLGVGGAGYVTDVLAFNWLRTTPALSGLDPTVSKVLAVAVAMVVTYLGNRMLTWRNQAATTARRREISLFVFFNLIGLGISVALLVVSHDVLGLTSRLADNLSANVVGLALGTAFRYWSYRRFVFTPAVVPVRTPGDPTTVHIISGSYGAGHDAAAHEIELRLREAGHVVRRWDVVDLFPAGLGRLLRWGYFEQLELSPGSWGLLLQHLQPGRLAHRVAVRFLALPGPRIREIAKDGAALFISTHPFASQALGRLRSTGRLDVPTVTYLTDASVHPLWINPGIDLSLALHDVSADQARALGGATTVVEPLVPRSYREPHAPSAWELRARLGLPVEDDLALVVGGSHGVGDLEASAADIVATGLARPVVACGHNDALRRRLALQPGVIALGWRDDMLDLIRASSCVVQNAGGFTSLEALAAGIPVISYRCLPGHGTTNAAALEQSGLVPWARDSLELGPVLAQAITAPRRAADLPGADVPSVLEALPLRSPVVVG